MQGPFTFTSLRSSLTSGCLFAPIRLSHLFPIGQNLFALSWLPVCVPLHRLVNAMVCFHCHSWNLIPCILIASLDACTAVCLCHSQELAEHVSCAGFLCIAQLTVPRTIPVALGAAEGPSLPRTSLEEIAKKSHILATGAVSALWNAICVRITLFKGSSISKMRMEYTFPFQGSCMSFESWNPEDSASSPQLLSASAATFRQLAVLFPIKHRYHLCLQTM